MSNKWGIDYKGNIHIGDDLDSLAKHALLERIAIDQKRITKRLLESGKRHYQENGFGGAWNISIDPYGFGVEWQVGVRHGMRSQQGITIEQELYLLYLENQWLSEEEARRDYGMQSDPVAEIILNRLGEDEYIEMLESGGIIPTEQALAEAKERNKHNLEKDYHPESYLKLKEKAEAACQAYRS